MSLRQVCNNFADATYNFQRIAWMLTGNLDDSHINNLSADRIVVSGGGLGGLAASLQEVYEDLGEIAWEDKVELSKLGETVIQGGYLLTSLIEVGSISWDKAQGGNLVLGGNNNVSGVLQIKNASGDVVVQGDNDGVVVKSGAAFRVDERGDGAEFTVLSKPNLLNDHSFELLKANTQDGTHWDWTIVAPEGNSAEWNIGGTPLIYTDLSTGNIPFAPWGYQAAIVTSANTFKQQFLMPPEVNLTLSGYVYPHPSRNTSGATINSRMVVKFYDTELTQIGTTITRDKLLTDDYTSGDTTLVRHVETVAVPSSTEALVIVEVSIASATTGTYVVWDGMQAVEGDYPTVYNPEAQLFALCRAVSGGARFLDEINIGIGTDKATLGWNDLIFNREAVSYIRKRGSSSLRFSNDAGGSETDVLTIASTKRVGVNTTNPSAALGVNGDVAISGALSKGSGTFLIDHPIIEGMQLYHGFVEAPRYDLIYRGKVKLHKGKAVVHIDAESNMSSGTFSVLTQNAEVVSLCNLTGYDRIKPTDIVDGIFSIIAENSTSSDTVTWVVIAERADQAVKSNPAAHTNALGRLIPERIKPKEVDVDAE